MSGVVLRSDSPTTRYVMGFARNYRGDEMGQGSWDENVGRGTWDTIGTL